MNHKIRIIAFVMIILGLVFSQCDKEEDYNISNLNHNIIMILGHAGMGDFYLHIIITGWR